MPEPYSDSRRACVAVCYVEWGSSRRDKSLTEILRIVRGAKAKLVEVVIIDNKGECAPAAPMGDLAVRVIAGSNRIREFGGWDEAYLALSAGRGADVLLFGNDTMGTHRKPRLLRRARFAAWIDHAAAAGMPLIFGQKDPFPESGVTSPFGLMRPYICTYLFGMNAAAAARLLPISQYDDEIDGLLPKQFGALGLFNETVPERYRQALNGWLLNPEKWYKAEPLTEKNFEFMRLKAKSILYEHAVTRKSEARGVQARDIFEGEGTLDKVAGKYARFWLGATKVNNIKTFWRTMDV